MSDDPFAPESNPDDFELIDWEMSHALERSKQYQLHHVPGSNKPEKKQYKKPEANVTDKIYNYLKIIGAIVIRTNAGSWKSEDGNYIQGAKAGTSDLTVCLPNGIFCAIEVKSNGGIQSDAQKRYQQRVKSLNGVYMLVYSAKNVQSALVDKFGIDIVRQWEQKKAS